MLQNRRRHLLPAVTLAALCVAALPARAQTSTATTDTSETAAPVPQTPQTPAPPVVNSLDSYFDTWWQHVAYAKATQPDWVSPVVTTTSILEDRIRFDTQFQHSGNDTDTIDLDGGKGADIIVSDTEEIQVALPPYYVRTAQSEKNALDGWNDWSFFRFKQRLISSPADEGDYNVSAWLQVSAPTGISKLTTHAWTLSPTLGFGKGWGPFVIQGTVGGVLPTAYQGKIGNQIASNLAFQYNVLPYIWASAEASWTYYPDGPKAHKSQFYLAPGLTVARIPLSKSLKLTVGVAYEVAVAPDYRPKPLLPTFDRAWILTTRVSF